MPYLSIVNIKIGEIICHQNHDHAPLTKQLTSPVKTLHVTGGSTLTCNCLCIVQVCVECVSND